MASNKDKAKQAAKRDERRRRQRAGEAGDGPTLGEVVAAHQLVGKTSHATRSTITRAEEFIRDKARVNLSVVACDTCTAPKGCCWNRTSAWMYEGIPIANRLRAEGRDTPELRQALQTAAALMEGPAEYRRPCVFLDQDERCTIYADRPAVCGTAFVSSDPAQCSATGGRINKHVHPFLPTTATAQDLFNQEAGMPPLERGYLARLPRVVLLCLQAWDRRDYAAFISGRLAEIAATAP